MEKRYNPSEEAAKNIGGQVGGNHYNQMVIQPIDYILKNSLKYCEGNIVKYVSRHRRKNGIEDLRKARQYLEFLAVIDYGEEL